MSFLKTALSQKYYIIHSQNYDGFTNLNMRLWEILLSQPVFTCSKLTIETLEQDAKYV